MALFDNFLANHFDSLRLETKHATFAAGPVVRRNGKTRSNRAPLYKTFLGRMFRRMRIEKKKKKQRRGRQNRLQTPYEQMRRSGNRC
jgi:hypothetical protein